MTPEAGALPLKASRGLFFGMGRKPSEPHASNVRDFLEYEYDRSDAVLGAVDAERLGNTRLQVNDDTTAAEFNDLVDEISTDEGGNGGTIELQSDVTVEAVDEVVWLKSDVRVVGNGATFRFADGLDGDAPLDCVINFAVDPPAVNAHLHDVEVDGNYSGNAWTQRYFRGGIQCRALVRDTENVNDYHFVVGERPRQCSIRDVEIFDTFGSSLNWSPKDSVGENITVRDTADDHWIYWQHPINSDLRNVRCEGYARDGIAFFNGDRPLDAKGSAIENVWMENLTYDTPEGGVLGTTINARPIQDSTSLDSEDWAEENVVEDCEISNVHVESDQARACRAVIENPLNVDGYHWRGAMDTSSAGVFTPRPGSGDAVFRDIKVIIEDVDSNPEFRSAVNGRGGSYEIRGVEVKDQSGAGVVIGVRIRPFSTPETQSALITGYDIDAGKGEAIRLSGDNVTVNNVVIGEGEIAADNEIRIDGTVNDTRIRNERIDRSDLNDESGTRTTLNGVGLNAGDPSNGNGEWAGNGREGVEVYDTSAADGTTYRYVNGQWV